MDRFFNCFALGNDNSSATKGASIRQHLGRSDSTDDKVVIDMGSSSSPPVGVRSFRTAAARTFFDCFSDEKTRNDTPDRSRRYVVDREVTPSKSTTSSARNTISPPKSVAIEINSSPSPPHNRPPVKEPSSKEITVAEVKNRTPFLIKSKKVQYNRLFCQEYSEDFTTVQFLMKIPLGAKPGQVIYNIGGRQNCSIKLPDYVVPGETVVLLARGDQKRVVSGASIASTSSATTDASAPGLVALQSAEQV